jgi:hypothetical protein
VREQGRENGRWNWEATGKWCSAKREIEFAEEGMKAAKWGGFGETVGKAALIGLIQEEAQSAQTRLDKSKKSKEKVKFREKCWAC